MTSEQTGDRLTGERTSNNNEQEIGRAFEDVRDTFVFCEEDLRNLERQTAQLPLDDLDSDIAALRGSSSPGPAEISPQLRQFSEEISGVVKSADAIASQYLGPESSKIEAAISYAADCAEALKVEHPDSNAIEVSRLASEKIVEIIASPEDPEASLNNRFAKLESTDRIKVQLLQLEDALDMPPSSPDAKAELAETIEELKKHVGAFGSLSQPVSEIVDASKDVLRALI